MKNFCNGIYRLKTYRPNDYYNIKQSTSYIYIQLQAHTIRMTPNQFYFLDKQELYETIFRNYSYNLGIQDIYEKIVKPLKQDYQIHLLHEREYKRNKHLVNSCDMNFSLEKILIF